MLFFFFKQKTAYEMRISDWSSDVCSSDLACRKDTATAYRHGARRPSDSAQAGGDRACGAPAARSFRRSQAASAQARRSEEHTSELQSLMRISYAVFCLKKKKIDSIRTLSDKM